MLRSTKLRSAIFVICIVLVALPLRVFAIPNCEDLLNREAAIRRAYFIESLRTANDRRAQIMLAEEKRRVEREIKALVAAEKEELGRHWAGINTGQVISSPIHMIAKASKELQLAPGQIFVDIGSGHGDPSLVFGAMNPQVEVTGYDFVKAKVQSAQRLADSMGLRNVEFIQQDLSDPNFHVRVADYYYFFNPANPNIVRKVVREIKENSKFRIPTILTLKGGWTDEIIRQEGFYQSRGFFGGRMAVYKLGAARPESNENKIAQLIKRAEDNIQRLNQDLKLLRESERGHLNRVERAKTLRERSAIFQKEIIKALLAMPLADSWAYLRSLRAEDLRLHVRYLDALFAINDIELSILGRWSLRELEEEHPQVRGLAYPEKISYDQTPWENLFSIVESMKLKPGDQVVDVGAGVSRLGFLIQLLHPGVKYIGYELNAGLARHTKRVIVGAQLNDMVVIQENVQANGWQVPQGTTHIAFLNALANGIHFRVYLEIYRYLQNQGFPKPMYVRQ